MREHEAIYLMQTNIDFFTATHCQFLNPYYTLFKASLSTADQHILSESEPSRQQQDSKIPLNISEVYPDWEDMILGESNANYLSMNKNSRFSATRDLSILTNIDAFKVKRESHFNHTRSNEALKLLCKINMTMIGETTDLTDYILNEERQELAEKWRQSDIMQCLTRIRGIKSKEDFAQIQKEYTKKILDACVCVRVSELQTIFTFLISNDDIELPTYTHIHDQFYSLNKASAFQKTLFEKTKSLNSEIKTNKKNKIENKQKLFSIQNSQLQHKVRKHPAVLARIKEEPTTLCELNTLAKDLSRLNMQPLINSYTKLYTQSKKVKPGIFAFYGAYLRYIYQRCKKQDNKHTLAIMDLAYSEYHDYDSLGKYKQAKEQMLENLTKSIFNGKHYYQLLSELDSKLLKYIQGRLFKSNTLKVVCLLQLMISQSPTNVEKNRLLLAHNEALKFQDNNFKLLQILLTVNPCFSTKCSAMVTTKKSKPYDHGTPRTTHESLADKLIQDIIDECVDEDLDSIIEEGEDYSISYTDMTTLKQAMRHLESKSNKQTYAILKTAFFENIFQSDDTKEKELPTLITKLPHKKREDAICYLKQVNTLLFTTQKQEMNQDTINSDLYWLAQSGASEEEIVAMIIKERPAYILTSIANLHIEFAERLNKHYVEYSDQPTHQAKALSVR
jgi:hypothetical protein